MKKMKGSNKWRKQIKRLQSTHDFPVYQKSKAQYDKIKITMKTVVRVR